MISSSSNIDYDIKSINNNDYNSERINTFDDKLIDGELINYVDKVMESKCDTTNNPNFHLNNDSTLNNNNIHHYHNSNNSTNNNEDFNYNHHYHYYHRQNNQNNDVERLTENSYIHKNKNNEFYQSSPESLEQFRNKKLEYWKPIYTPNYLILIYLFIGIAFVSMGIYLQMHSSLVIECKVPYEDSPGNGTTIDTIVELKSEHCNPSTMNGRLIKHIDGDVYLYYQLTNFYQNDRNYIVNRSDKQLKGEVILDEEELSSCYPFIKDKDGRILLPCGIAANSVFNDTYKIFDGQGDLVDIDDSLETITIKSDRARYKNPPKSEIIDKNINDWLPEEIFPGKIENPHFIVWMRISAFSTFNKLYGKLISNKKKLILPLKIVIKNRYPSHLFQGTKHILISQTTWLGGKNPYFGILYLISGILFIFLSIYYIVKNKLNNNALGDLRFLYWINSIN